jgi:hypothetical protein
MGNDPALALMRLTVAKHKAAEGTEITALGSPVGLGAVLIYGLRITPHGELCDAAGHL